MNPLKAQNLCIVAQLAKGAHGAVDFWGIVWERTSTIRSEEDGSTVLGIKGGSWELERGPEHLRGV